MTPDGPDQTTTVGRRLMEIESEIDRLLPHARKLERPAPELVEALRKYSDRISGAAVDCGPSEDLAALGTIADTIARNPVFILGAHRSGTTLLQNLLDGHPELLVLPSEGTYLTNIFPKVRRRPPEEQCALVVREWTERLVKPQGQPPYWSLGRSTSDRAPYLNVARNAIWFFERSRGRLAEHSPFEPFLSVVVALAFENPRSTLARYWVDKTPLNEFHVPVLKSAFPGAKFVHMVRDPRAIAASRMALNSRVLGDPGSLFRLAVQIRRSLRVAVENRRSENYHVVRYEDLIDDVEATMEGVRKFLDLRPDATLLRPTAAGLATTANSSHDLVGKPGEIVRESEPPFEQQLGRAQIGLIESLTGPYARSLAYAVDDRGRAFKILNYVREAGFPRKREAGRTR